VSRTAPDIVHTLIDAINRGDWGNVLKDADPGFELDVSRAFGPYRGIYTREDAERVFSEFAQGWESLRIEEGTEFLQAGDDLVGTSTLHVEGRDGIRVTSTVTWVWKVRDGKLARATMFQERDEALEAVGLRPSSS
jgi:ketosteroid isomerase-like protein